MSMQSISFTEVLAPKDVVFSEHQEPKTLRVEWQHPQCKLTGFILHYNIYYCMVDKCDGKLQFLFFSADLKNQPVGSSCVTHILPFYGYFKGQEQTGFNPTSWHLVTYNFL